jgi:hypothetical protein
MLRKEDFDHEFAQSDWNAAKEEARAIMIKRAKSRNTISYSELVSQIRSIRLDPHDARLDHFLGQISSEEDSKGLGMLTVLVVHKSGDLEPGKGFYELAHSLGRDISDREKCWAEELQRVYEVWSDRPVNFTD